MLYEFLKENILTNPNKTIRDVERTVTYAESIKNAEQLGDSLIHQKYGILCKSELNAAIGLLACFYAKKTPVMLSHRYDENHIQKVIRSIKLSHIITDEGVVEISEVKTEKEKLDDVALIMCVAASGGYVRGLMITEENLLININEISDCFKITKNDKIFISRSLYHCSVLIGELLISFVKGLDIIFFNNDFIPGKIAEFIEEQGISILCTTPTLYSVISNFSIDKKEGKALPLKTIAIDGRGMTFTIAGKMFRAFISTKFYSIYCLSKTKSGVGCMSWEMFSRFPITKRKSSKLIETKVINKKLYIKPQNTVKGYYEDIELTKNRLKDGWLCVGEIFKNDFYKLRLIK